MFNDSFLNYIIKDLNFIKLLDKHKHQILFG